MKTLKRILLIAVLIAAVVAVGMIYAPGFLAYSTSTAKVDAVILLLGPDFSARHRHARDLIKQGKADYLIIPAYNKTYHINQGTIKLIPVKTGKNNINSGKKPVMPRYYEDTHLELIDAKKTMEMYGQKSAIFVSSPYHMRRIQLIVDREFNHRYKSYFSPTPFESAPLNIWELKVSDWKKVWREYIKILWFTIYSLWT